MKPAAALLFLLAWPLRLAAAQVTLSASAQTVTIAEPIELRVVVRADPGVRGIRVQVPSGAYDIIGRSARPAVRTGEALTYEEVITVAFFRTGEFMVGPFTVELLPKRDGSGSEQTGQLAVRVRSLLGENDKDIKPLKELLAIRGDPRHLLPYAAALLLLLILIFLFLMLRRKLQRERRPGATPPLPPEIELEMRARELRERNLPDAGEFREFFITLSEMVKHFIQRAYGFPAEDCTSAETVARLRDCEHDAETIAHLQEIFGQSDLVKFARQVPEKETAARIWPMIAALVAMHKQRRAQRMEATDVQARR